MQLNKLAIGLALFSAVSMAQAEVAANIGATSNYVWRGVTQTGDEAAIQGGIDYAADSGFYLGTWASNVNGGEEVDVYAGYSGEVGELGYDIGATYYIYPSADPDANFAEIHGSISYSLFSLGLNYTIASDTDDTDAGNETFIKGDVYYYISAGTDLSDGWSIGGTLGHYDFADDGVAGTDTAYTHVQLDVTKSAGDFGDMTFSISKADEESGDEDPIVFISWGKTF